MHTHSHTHPLCPPPAIPAALCNFHLDSLSLGDGGGVGVTLIHDTSFFLFNLNNNNKKGQTTDLQKPSALPLTPPQLCVGICMEATIAVQTKSSA